MDEQDKHPLREMVRYAVQRRMPVPEWLEEVVREEYEAAGGDVEQATEELIRRLGEEPALIAAVVRQETAVRIVEMFLDDGFVYDAATDRWYRPDPPA